MSSKAFWLCFIPLFVAVDAFGILPVFLSLTEGLGKKEVRKVLFESILTATAVAVVFLAIGEVGLRLLGISVADFMIAGGALLFGLSLSELLILEKQHHRLDSETLGAVPIGVPIIVGPAVLTTTLLLVRQHGFMPVIVALIANIFIAGVVLWFSSTLNDFFGKAGSKTISKLASLLLAAIGVMMVRKGIMLMLAG
jgi:multiple antibiotic resistance protein